jgi:hypothetical protein
MRISNGTHSVTLLPTYLRRIAPPPAGPVPEVGQILNGKRWGYRIVKVLEGPCQRSVAFKADILPGKHTAVPAAQYAMSASYCEMRLTLIQRFHQNYGSRSERRLTERVHVSQKASDRNVQAYSEDV